MSEHSPKSNTTPLIKPSSKSNSTTLPKHKNALPRATNSKQEQPINIDPNTILRHSLITTNYYFDVHHQKTYIFLKDGEAGKMNPEAPPPQPDDKESDDHDDSQESVPPVFQRNIAIFA
jgi:hypothetical protein